MSCCSSFSTLQVCPCAACWYAALEYCAVRFPSRVPTWRLPVSGHAAGLVTAEGGVAEAAGVEVGGGEEGGGWLLGCGSGPGRKRIRLNRKKPCTPRGSVSHSMSATCVEEIASCWSSFVPLADCTRRRYDQQDEGYVPV